MYNGVDLYGEVLNIFEKNIKPLTEEIRRADIHVMQNVLDDLRWEVEGLADDGRMILKKSEDLQRLDDLILDIADEISGFPYKLNISSMTNFGYDGNRLDAGLYLYNNVVEDLPPDRVTYCALVFDFFDEPGLEVEDSRHLNLDDYERYYYKPDREGSCS